MGGVKAIRNITVDRRLVRVGLRSGGTAVMAAVTAANKHTGDSPSRRSRVLSRGGGGVVGETWKSHIIRQLKHRDRSQRARFQDLIRYCTRKLS